MEGIRYSTQIALHSYERLKTTAAEYSAHQLESGQSDATGLRIELLADAWSILDTLNRLRVLLGSYPVVGARDLSAVRVFFRRAKSVEAIRNRFQHLDTVLPRRIELERASQAVLGQLSWVYWDNHTNASSPIYVFGIIGGSAPQDAERQQTISLPVLSGGEVEVPVGRIDLRAFGALVSLSEQLANLRLATGALEAFLPGHFNSRAELAARQGNVDREVLLSPMVECSGFYARVGFGKDGPSAADEVQVVTSYKNPPITF